MLRRSALTALTGALLASAGCGAADRPRGAPPGPAASATVASASKAVGFARFSRTWEAKVLENVTHVVVTGDAVATFAGGSVRTFSRTDGSARRSARSGCMTLDAAAGKDGSLIVACIDGINALDRETLASRSLKRFDSTALAATISKEEIVVELMVDDPKTPLQKELPFEIVAYEADSLKERRRLPPAEGQALGLASNDAGLLAGIFPRSVQINRHPNERWRPLVKGAQLLFAAPSRSGERLFLATPTDGSMAVDVATATVARKWSGALPMVARWMGDEAVAVVDGLGGIRILEMSGTEARSVQDDVYNSLAVSPEGDALCAHSMIRGKLSCYFVR